jgi:hypothetical protein
MLTMDFGCGLQKIEQFWYVRIDTLGIKTYMQCSMELNYRNKSDGLEFRYDYLLKINLIA